MIQHPFRRVSSEYFLGVSSSRKQKGLQRPRPCLQAASTAPEHRAQRAHAPGLGGAFGQSLQEVPMSHEASQTIPRVLKMALVQEIPPSDPMLPHSCGVSGPTNLCRIGTKPPPPLYHPRWCQAAVPGFPLGEQVTCDFLGWASPVRSPCRIQMLKAGWYWAFLQERVGHLFACRFLSQGKGAASRKRRYMINDKQTLKI